MPTTIERPQSTWNPGTPTVPVKIGNGLYECMSWRGENVPPYRQDLNRNTCTCPQNADRGKLCKHLKEAFLSSFRDALVQARQMKEGQLLALLAKYHHTRPDIRQALVTALFEQGTVITDEGHAVNAASQAREPIPHGGQDDIHSEHEVYGLPAAFLPRPGQFEGRSEAQLKEQFR